MTMTKLPQCISCVLPGPKHVPLVKKDKNCFLQTNHQTQQIDQRNVPNMKIYVVGVKNYKR